MVGGVVSRSVHEGFTERFQQALGEAGLASKTQKELGRLFGVSGQAVNKWQSGESIPTAERAPLIARVLKVRRAWLLDNELPMRTLEGGITETGKGYGATPELRLSWEEHQLLTQFRQLPKRVQKDWLRLLTGVGEVLEKQSSEQEKGL